MMLNVDKGRLAVLLLVALMAFVGCSGEETQGEESLNFDFSGDEEVGEDFEEFSAAKGKADGLDFDGSPLEFKTACEEGQEVTIAAVGDLLIHGRLQRQALGHDEGFGSLWSGIKDLMAAADVTYANLEGPTAPGTNKFGRDTTDPGKSFDDNVYSSYPMFNYHPSLLTDLIDSGVDVVSTANNHSLDRRSLGADRTIEELERVGMPYTGTRRKGDDQAPWHTVTNGGGCNLAWLARTYGPTGTPDPHKQVLMCFEDTDEIESIIQTLSAAPEIDAVIVTPHWGQEYKATPNGKQIDLAHRLLDAGATLILGSHPHVLQPWERYETRDGRQTFVIYSLGNFVSGQRHLPRRSTLLLYVSLRRLEDGSVTVSGARYVPLHMTTRSNGFMTLEAIDRVGAFADSRALTVDMFGHWNLHQAEPPVTMNPECDPQWVPPHEHDGWIGGSCQNDTVCGGTFCDVTMPDGLCTQSCERFCPDLAGRPGTFCVADPQSDETGLCVLTCESDADCRQGYACQEQPRFNEPDTIKQACVPVKEEPVDDGGEMP